MGRPSKHGRLDFDLRKRSRCEPILAKEKRILYDALFSLNSRNLDFKIFKN